MSNDERARAASVAFERWAAARPLLLEHERDEVAREMFCAGFTACGERIERLALLARPATSPTILRGLLQIAIDAIRTMSNARGIATAATAAAAVGGN